ncbi:MAG: thioredoxin family protein [Planctomycetota bacterium]
MRRLIPLLLALALPASAAPAPKWLTDFKKAKEESKKSGRPILVDFTGSDWCGWCKKLKAEVFDTDAFRAWAAKNVILLEVDFPRGKQLPGKVKEQNEKLKGDYKISGYPTVLFLDHEERVLGQSGYRKGGPAEWTSNADSILASAKTENEPQDEGGWLTDHKKAVELSRRTRKPILVDFTGSDWCGWCKKLKSEVFDTDAFRAWAAKNVILLEVDFPRGKQLPGKVEEQNEKLKSDYKIRGFPTILFLDAKGAVLGQSGYREGGPAPWIRHAESLLK